MNPDVQPDIYIGFRKFTSIIYSCHSYFDRLSTNGVFDFRPVTRSC